MKYEKSAYYRWFKYDENEKDFHLDIYGETFKDNINIVINDLKYANRGIYYTINDDCGECDGEFPFDWLFWFWSSILARVTSEASDSRKPGYMLMYKFKL